MHAVLARVGQSIRAAGTGLFVAVLAAPAAAATGSASLTGINLNALLGAERFYNAGYDGSGVIQANIEINHLWLGHEVFHGSTHVTQFITGHGSVGAGFHATGVAHLMGGRGTVSYPGQIHRWGIAPGADLWSGAIEADGVNQDRAIWNTYDTALRSGVGGSTAHVFNSSWGLLLSGQPFDQAGRDRWTLAVDGMIYDSGAFGVFSAGNSGPNFNTVAGPGSGYNMITVGALGDYESANPYTIIPDLSSRGPNDFYHRGTNTVIPATATSGRAVVDIAAPGTGIVFAHTDPANPYYAGDGTSFAAPLVAGGATLMVQAGLQLHSANPGAIDGRVIKAALLNSADKLPGWDNGQATIGGTIVTTQSMDWAMGTGRMNLSRAFDQYVLQGDGGRAGTAGVTPIGPGDMGAVAKVGWDFSSVSLGGENLYYIDKPFAEGDLFTITLSWFAARDAGELGPPASQIVGADDVRLANLDLRVFQFDDLDSRNIVQTVAVSESLYNVVEHLHFNLPADGFYGFGVRYDNHWWNFSEIDTELYGIAWVPEPGSAVLLLFAAAGFMRRRRG